MKNRLVSKLYADLSAAPARLARSAILGFLVWAIARHALYWAFLALFYVTGARPLPTETHINYGESILAPLLAYLVLAFGFGARMLFDAIDGAGGDSLLFVLFIPRPLLGLFGIVVWPLGIVIFGPFAVYLTILSIARGFGARKAVGDYLTRNSGKVIQLDYARDLR